MWRTCGGLVLGFVLGIASVLLLGESYTYHEVASAGEAMSFINTGGWQVVPGQPDPLYLRHPTVR